MINGILMMQVRPTEKNILFTTMDIDTNTMMVGVEEVNWSHYMIQKMIYSGEFSLVYKCVDK